MFDKAKFRAALALSGMTMEQLSAKIGINPATLSKKVNGATQFSLSEIYMIRILLSLSMEQMEAIFFAEEIA